MDNHRDQAVAPSPYSSIMEKKHSKIAVIGAGAVGASTAYSIAMKNLVSEMAIIDVNRDKAEGEAMDIRHSLSILGEMNVHCGDYSDVADCDVIIVAAGLGRKPGETRLDLARKNVGIAKEITRNIMQHYNGGVIMVVSNPVDIITYIIQEESQLPPGIVFGTGTVLDSARFRRMLSERLGVDVRNVHGFIAGEHGDTQFAVWSSVHVGGMTLDAFCKARHITIDKAQIEEDVIKSGAEVIKRKGATYYAIASIATCLAEVILKDQKSIFFTSNRVNGLYGLDDLCLSLPNLMGQSGAEYTIELNFTDEELIKLKKSANAIKTILDEIKAANA